MGVDIASGSTTSRYGVSISLVFDALPFLALCFLFLFIFLFKKEEKGTDEYGIDQSSIRSIKAGFLTFPGGHFSLVLGICLDRLVIVHSLLQSR